MAGEGNSKPEARAPGGTAQAEAARQSELQRESRLVARDDRKNPLISTFAWTDEAKQRIFRVPAGFMRNKTQERIEELARERGAATIDLALVDLNLRDGLTGPQIGRMLCDKGTKVVFVTANPRLLGDGIAGAVGVITKPTDEDTLRQAVDYALGTVEQPPAALRLFG